MISSFSVRGAGPAGVTHCPPPAMQSGADEGPFVFIRAWSELVKRYSSFSPLCLLPSLSVALTHKMCTASARKKSILNQNICTRWHRTWSDRKCPGEVRVLSFYADLCCNAACKSRPWARPNHWPSPWILWSWQVCLSCQLIASSCLLTPWRGVDCSTLGQQKKLSETLIPTLLLPRPEGIKIQASSFTVNRQKRTIMLNVHRGKRWTCHQTRQ